MADYLLLVEGNGDRRLSALFARLTARLSGRMDAQPKRRLVFGDALRGGAAFDGIGVFGDRLVRDAASALTVTGSGRGNYFLARHEPSGAITLEIDPFGYYPLYLYHKDGLFCVGNRAQQVVQALEACGRPCPRDLSVHGWFIGQGSGAFDLSAHRDVKLLPRGTRITVDPENRIEYRRAPPLDIFYADRPLPELIDEAAAEIQGNIRALARADFDHRICDLTGGMDSRVVVAALVSDRLDADFLFYTKGSQPNPDANVAALIRQKFKLRAATAVVPPRASSAGPFDRLRASVGHVDGLLSTFFGAGSDLGGERILSLGGGSGELLREFWRSGTPGLVGQSRGALDDKIAMLSTRTKLLRDEVRREMGAAVRAFAKKAVADGFRPEHVGDLFYLSSRARYHFGVWWASSARARFHPLYSPAALRAAHAMDNAEKAAGRLSFELIRRFCPELLALPFADKRWPPILMPDAPPPVTRHSPFLGDPDEKRVALFPQPRRRSAPRTEWEDQLAAKGAKARVIELGHALREFDPSARKFDALAPVFKPEAVARFLSQPPEAFTGRYDTDNAYRLLGAYVWANRLELPRETARLPEAELAAWAS